MDQMITKFGFPIAAACSIAAAFWVVVKNFMEKDKANTQNINKIMRDMRTDHKATIEMYRQEIKETREQYLQELEKDRKVYVSSIKSVVDRVENIEDTVEEIKAAVQGGANNA